MSDKKKGGEPTYAAASVELEQILHDNVAELYRLN